MNIEFDQIDPSMHQLVKDNGSLILTADQFCQGADRSTLVALDLTAPRKWTFIFSDFSQSAVMPLSWRDLSSHIDWDGGEDDILEPMLWDGLHLYSPCDADFGLKAVLEGLKNGNSNQALDGLRKLS